jgi:hypothetical protein
MQTHFSSLGQHSTATARIPEAEVLGSGGISTPQLGIPLRLDVRHGAMRPADGLELVFLTAKLLTVDGYHSVCPPVLVTTILQRRDSRPALLSIFLLMRIPLQTLSRSEVAAR